MSKKDIKKSKKSKVKNTTKKENNKLPASVKALLGYLSNSNSNLNSIPKQQIQPILNIQLPNSLNEMQSKLPDFSKLDAMANYQQQRYSQQIGPITTKSPIQQVYDRPTLQPIPIMQMTNPTVYDNKNLEVPKISENQIIQKDTKVKIPKVTVDEFTNYNQAAYKFLKQINNDIYNIKSKLSNMQEEKTSQPQLQPQLQPQPQPAGIQSSKMIDKYILENRLGPARASSPQEISSPQTILLPQDIEVKKEFNFDVPYSDNLNSPKLNIKNPTKSSDELHAKMGTVKEKKKTIAKTSTFELLQDVKSLLTPSQQIELQKSKNKKS